MQIQILDDYNIDGFVSYLRQITDDLNLPELNKYGIGPEDIGFICRKTEIKNNPVRLNQEDWKRS